MRIVTKAFFIILVGFSLRILFSCCDCPADPGKVYYRIDSIELLTLDNSGRDPIVKETESIPKQAFGLKVQYGISEISNYDVSENPFFTTATACSCLDPKHVPGEAVTINITTINKFDAEHSAGSDVTSLFRVLSAGKYYPVEEYVSNPDVIQVPEEMYLLTAPEASGIHQFEVMITMPDGRVVSSVTREVNLE